MTMPFYSSVDQMMRDRSELARKGIARGRSVVVLTYAGGVLFVAENRSTTLHKVSEIYDRIGFAAVGRYNEFENLRNGGHPAWPTCAATPTTGATSPAGSLANAYAQTLGTIFIEQQKPFEVELCVAEVGADARRPTSSTGSPTTARSPTSRSSWSWAAPPSRSARSSRTPTGPGSSWARRSALAVEALQATATPSGGSGSGGNGAPGDRVLGVSALEVAVLDRSRPRRTFRRITGAALRELLPERNRAVDTPVGSEVVGGDDTPAGGGAAEDRRPAERRRSTRRQLRHTGV